MDWYRECHPNPPQSAKPLRTGAAFVCGRCVGIAAGSVSVPALELAVSSHSALAAGRVQPSGGMNALALSPTDERVIRSGPNQKANHGQGSREFQIVHARSYCRFRALPGMSGSRR